MAHDVFISYSHNDKQVADAICSVLERNNVRCWYAPRDIDPGKEWANAIIEAIPKAKIFVLVFSESSNMSNQVIREVSKAVNDQLTIIPFKIDEAVPTGSMEYYLNAIHWLDAFDGELAEHIGELTRRVLTALEMDDTQINEADPINIKKRPAKKSKLNLVGILLAAALLIGAGIWGVTKLKGTNGGGNSQGTPPSSVSVPSNEGAVITDAESSYTSGNLQCNLSNTGICAAYEGWIYYVSNDEHCLYKMEPNSSEKTKLTQSGVSNISVYDGWVYYTDYDSPSSIRRTKTDGSKTELLYDGHCEGLRIINDMLYFKDGRKSLHLTRMNLDGTNPTVLNEIDKLYHFVIADEHVYYSNQEDKGCMYRVNLDGSDPVKLSDQPVDNIAVAGGYIIYTVAPTGKASTLHAMNMETFEDTELYMDYFYDITVSDYGIIASSGANKRHIYKLPLNKNAAEEICSDVADDIGIAYGWVFYVNRDDGLIYRVDANGEYKEVMN